jgi:hypothetical protein
MAKTRFSGPVFSDNGFGQPVAYILAANTTDIGVTSVNINAGGTYVIIAENQGGPNAAVTLVLPEVVSGTFSPTSQPSDTRYDGIRGQVFNQDGSLVHILKGFGTQPVNANAAGVNVAAGKVVQWMGNGNQSAPWLAITNDLAANA